MATIIDTPNPITLDPAVVVQWVTAHKWAPVIALVLGLIVRLLKNDSKLNADLPSIFRPYLALFLGLLGAYAAAVLGGLPWQSAIENGFMAFIIATLGHQTIVEGVRNGVEIPIPFLTKSPVIALPAAPPTIVSVPVKTPELVVPEAHVTVTAVPIVPVTPAAPPVEPPKV